jgi:microcystin-dependent protein
VADPFVAEIRIFGFNFAPTGWAFCDGQILPISQNTALFALIGTFYGGDGKSTFALPNFEGSAPIHQGQGPGLSEYVLGQSAGSESITLLDSEMPFHTHSLRGSTQSGDNPNPANPPVGFALARYPNIYQANTTQNLTQLGFQVLPPQGSSLPHNHMMPFLTLNFCIALQGVFPQRP